MSMTKKIRPWNFKQGFLILVSFTLLYISLSALHMVWVKSTIGFDEYIKNDTDFYTKLLIAGQSIKAVAIFLTIYFIALKRYQLNWHQLGFVPTTKRWLLMAVLVAIVGFFLRLLLMKFMAYEMPEWARFMKPPLHNLHISGAVLGAFLLLTIIITPVVEEVFFRGFLFQWMSGHRPVWLAAIVSSLMFGVSHIIPPQAISAALMSLMIIALYVYSRSLWPAIVCHMFNNALSIGGNILARMDRLPDYLMPPT